MTLSNKYKHEGEFMKKFVLFSLFAMSFSSLVNAQRMGPTGPIRDTKPAQDILIYGDGFCEIARDDVKDDIYLFPDDFIYETDENEEKKYIGLNKITKALSNAGFKPSDYKIEFADKGFIEITSLDGHQNLIEKVLLNNFDIENAMNVSFFDQKVNTEAYEDCYFKALAMAKEVVLKKQEILGIEKIMFHAETSDSDFIPGKQILNVHLKYIVPNN